MKIKKGYDKNKTYFEFTKKTGVCNVFVHGVGLNNTMWHPQKEFFKNKKTIYYDILNHGKTNTNFKELKFEYFSKQLLDLLEYLDIKKINLIGFSLGSLIAQHFASKYFKKINKLIILGSVYKRSSSQIIKVKKRYNLALNGKSISHDSINRWFNKNYLKKNKHVYNFFLNILEKKNNKKFLPAYKLFVESDNYDINFNNLKMKTLIATGEKEIGSTPAMTRKINKKISKSKIFIIPNAKHMATYEKSEIVNKLISNFI